MLFVSIAIVGPTDRGTAVPRHSASAMHFVKCRLTSLSVIALFVARGLLDHSYNLKVFASSKCRRFGAGGSQMSRFRAHQARREDTSQIEQFRMSLLLAVNPKFCFCEPWGRGFDPFRGLSAGVCGFGAPVERLRFEGVGPRGCSQSRRSTDAALFHVIVI